MASSSHLILCNGVKETSAATKAWRKVKPESLQTGDGGNVRLEIYDLAEQIQVDVPPLVADLVEIATLVYAADQTIKRAGWKTISYGDDWKREFRFEIGVRKPEFWNQPDVIDTLCDTLGFLSGDLFDFIFSANPSPTPFQKYMRFTSGSPDLIAVESVMLFSGGLDSLCGAVDRILARGEATALVSHTPSSQLVSRQRDLVRELTRRAAPAGNAPMHVTLVANKRGLEAQDYTQRTRSFLFASLGAAVASMLGHRQIDFYENGIVSVNLPLCDQEVNGRASRTTHPQVLRGFSELLSKVIHSGFVVVNQLLWATKQDVVQKLKDMGHADLISQSYSCTHTRLAGTPHGHCGVCSQCVSRRFAILGADVSANDPLTLYKLDALLGQRTTTPLRILGERFVGSARQIENMQDSGEFLLAHAAELSRAYPFLGMPSETGVARLFELHKRHSEQVMAVLKDSMRKYLEDHILGRLAPDSLLSYAFLIAALATEASRALSDGEKPILTSAVTSLNGDDIAETLERLNPLERRILGELVDRGIFANSRTKRPSQKTVAKWLEINFDTTLKIALSALVKVKLLDNGKHESKRGGYYLTHLGRLAGEMLLKTTGHDQSMNGHD